MSDVISNNTTNAPRHPLREDLLPGNMFPDFKLPDHNGSRHSLTEILNGFPGVLIFGRGYFCPKDRRQMTNYVNQLQADFRVNDCAMITVSVDNIKMTQRVRDGLGAEWIFLSDAHRKLLHELDMVDRLAPEGEIYIPYTFILDGDRTIFKVYNGWYFLGRPTAEEIRMDLRALMSRRPDWFYPGE